MILYHGSNILIREIDLSMSKVGKDFGCGFYLSSDKTQALELAGYTLEWARFVLMNRKNRTRIQAHDYDIVIGPIANDAVGFQIRRLTSGLIDIDRFMEELKYMKGVTMQYFFGTEKALKYLTRIDEV